MKTFPTHKPKQIEYVGQRKKTDCGIACAAMLGRKTYGEALEVLGLLNKNIRGGLYPEDVFEMLEEFEYSTCSAKKLPAKGEALIALQWKDLDLSGHYVVWDSKRKQFLDPLFGVINKRDMLKHAEIEEIWKVKRNKKS